MSTVAVVILSVMAGMLILALLASIATVIYFQFRIRQAATVLSETAIKFYAENAEALDNQRGQLVNIAESAKANFSGIRNEMRQALEIHQKQIQETLESHRTAFNTAIEKINANKLLEASQRGIAACNRLERVAAALQRWRLEMDEGEEPPEAAGGLGPEEYGPSNGSGPTIYDRRPDDVLDSTVDEGERLPPGL